MSLRVVPRAFGALVLAGRVDRACEAGSRWAIDDVELYRCIAPAFVDPPIRDEPGPCAVESITYPILLTPAE